MPRPTLPDDKRKRPITVYLTPRTLARLASQAQAEGVTVGQWSAYLLAKASKAHGGGE